MDTKPFYTTRGFYLSMTVLVIAVLAIAFVTVTRGLLTQVDRALVVESKPSATSSLNSENYAILDQKLDLPEAASTTVSTSTVATATSTATTTAVVATSTPVQTVPTIDVSKLTVAVRNATGVTGLAASVRDELTGAGFAKASTGNATAQPRTEVYIRANVRDAVVAILKEKLPNLLVDADIMEKEPTSADIVIILGKE